jgi:hypothetical protein
MIEPLESRQFLSGDIAVLTSHAVPTSHSSAIVAKPAAVSAGQTIFGSAKVGVKLKFKKTASLRGNGVFGGVYESGTFTDEKGNTGTYKLQLPPTPLPAFQPVQALTLKFTKAKLNRALIITFTPASKRLKLGLNNKTVTFVKTPGGASARALLTPSTIGTVYLKY